ncbi:fimbria/pilus outer membrane usher protein, partial [Klebsiella pneumoniae]|uniref:fimbria/pilus outer membrane usher protein n=1 Tax=Klebsiella pneumoniae TaxID=573 RepID=UPI0013D1F2AB
LLFDYYVNGQTRHTNGSQGSQDNSLSGNGTLGANTGPWRLRADWQARYDHTTGSGERSQRSWDWSRYYAYRALPALRSKLTVGEDSFYS